MKTTRVYDLPTRAFHWLFATGFLGAFLIAKILDDESVYYPYHMLLGLILVLAVTLRIVWGLVGSRYARFSSFALKPTQLIQYFKNLLSAKTESRLGHNPASSWAALTMMGLALGLAITGYLMTVDINKEVVEEVHELLANAFILVAIAHVSGVLLHTLRHRDWIALSMIRGSKKSIEGETGIERSHWGTALAFVLIVGGFVFFLSKNYDSGEQALNVFGSTLQLGEHEDEDHDHGE